MSTKKKREKKIKKNGVMFFLQIITSLDMDYLSWRAGYIHSRDTKLSFDIVLCFVTFHFTL